MKRLFFMRAVLFGVICFVACYLLLKPAKLQNLLRHNLYSLERSKSLQIADNLVEFRLPRWGFMDRYIRGKSFVAASFVNVINQDCAVLFVSKAKERQPIRDLLTELESKDKKRYPGKARRVVS